MIKSKLTTFYHLPAAEKRWVLRALFWLPTMAVGLRGWGFNRWYGWLHRRPTPPVVPDLGKTTAVARSVRRAVGNSLYDANCLKRSLTLWWLLRQAGQLADLRIGVRRDEAGQFEAHAWVEQAGVVLNDSPTIHEKYKAFDTPILPIQL